MMAQQLSGNAVLLTYRPDVYSSDVDDSSNNADTFIIILGCVKVIGTVIALYFVDRIGRRMLLLVGITCMSASWSILIAAGLLNIPTLAVVGACFVITSYSISFGCLSWVIISEIFPDEYRSRAIGFSMIINWLFNFVVMSSYISMSETFMECGAFAFYMAMCILSLICAYYFVPETKSRDYMEINSDLTSKVGKFVPSLLEKVNGNTNLEAVESPPKLVASALNSSDNDSNLSASCMNMNDNLTANGDSSNDISKNCSQEVQNEMHVHA